MLRVLAIALLILPIWAETYRPLDILSSSYSKSAAQENMFLGQQLSKHHFLLLSEKDKTLTRQLLMEALEHSPSFVEHKWTNASNQHKGTVSVSPVTSENTHTSRKFNVIIHAQDEVIRISGQAYRDDANQCWKILGEQSNE